MPWDTYWMACFAFGSLLPILLLIRPIRDRFGENSSVPYKGNIVAVYFIIVMMCELMAIGVSLKYLAVIFGFSDSI